MADDQLWKRRFYLFMGVRLVGVVTLFVGLAIMFSDLVRPGGWPAVGAVIVLVGLTDAIVAPRLIKKQWEREERAGRGQ
jgi:hypothetical protein